MAFEPSTLTTHLPTTPSAGIKTLARFGFAAKGVVYLLMGGLALMAATGMQGGRTADKKQAVQTLQSLPMGQFLLGLVAFGLLGYIVWRLVQAVRDTEDKGSDAKGLARRVGYAASGLVYAGLAYYAAQAAWQGSAPASGSDTRKSIVASVLKYEYGHWLVGAAALTIIGVGIYQMVRAYSGAFAKHVNASSLSAGQQRIVHRMGQVGYTARGIVLGILGYFLLQAARHHNASEVQDTGGAFDLLHSMGMGVLTVVALGLMAYGLYMLVQAKFPVLRGV